MDFFSPPASAHENRTFFCDFKRAELDVQVNRPLLSFSRGDRLCVLDSREVYLIFVRIDEIHPASDDVYDFFLFSPSSWMGFECDLLLLNDQLGEGLAPSFV